MGPIKNIITEMISDTMIKSYLADLLWPNNQMTIRNRINSVDQFISAEYPGQSVAMVYTIVKNEMEDLDNDNILA